MLQKISHTQQQQQPHIQKINKKITPEKWKNNKISMYINIQHTIYLMYKWLVLLFFFFFLVHHMYNTNFIMHGCVEKSQKSHDIVNKEAKKPNQTTNTYYTRI